LPIEIRAGLDDLFEGEEALWDQANQAAGAIISGASYKPLRVEGDEVVVQVDGFYEKEDEEATPTSPDGTPANRDH
jgi:hypothetical protein